MRFFFEAGLKLVPESLFPLLYLIWRRSQNKLFLNTDSLLLDLVSGQGDAGIKSSMGNGTKKSWR